MQVEVVYALTGHQRVCTLTLAAGAVVGDALQMASARPEFDDVDFGAHAVGVYGQVCEPNRVLADGDRVEIYRELQVDAKEARRRRAKSQQQDQ